MNIISKWIKFIEAPPRPSVKKTKIWNVANKDEESHLGQIKWYGRWRKYAFFPAYDTIFEEECLRDISFFCEQVTREHRQKAKK